MSSPTPDFNPLARRWGSFLTTLCRAFEQGDEERFLEVLGCLRRAHERNLVNELRSLEMRLARLLQHFRPDPRLLQLPGSAGAAADLSVEQVLEMSEQTALRTMHLFERIAPLAARVTEQAAALLPDCTRSRADEGLPPEFGERLARIQAFLRSVLEDFGKVRAELLEALPSRGHQDLSGQIIRGVLDLARTLEQGLARAVRASETIAVSSAPSDGAAQKSAHGFGPAIPGVTADAVHHQQDVDRLFADGGTAGDLA